MFDIDKFSIAQMTSNDNGKTSSSGSMGVLAVTVGLCCFVAGVVYYFRRPDATIIVNSLILIGTGKALLWYRKSKEDVVK